MAGDQADLSQRIQKIQAGLPASVCLIAVTKQVDTATIYQAYQAGIRHFAENYVQEAALKQSELQQQHPEIQDITWHLIGHLQSNKAKKALQMFEYIHSCDRLSLAQAINQQAKVLGKTPRVLLQVKLKEDANKSGWSEEQLWASLPDLASLENLRLCGLMAILPVGLAEEESFLTFERLRDLAAKINRQAILPYPLVHLSMGMSDDYQIAVRAGATMVRLGRAIFGDRPRSSQG